MFASLIGSAALKAVWSFVKAWWPYIVIAIGVVVLAVGVWRWDDARLERAREEGRAEIRAQFDAYRAKQQQIVTNLALLWAQAVQSVEVRYVEVVKERVVRYAGLRERAGRIRQQTDAIACPVPVAASRVLRDAATAANSAAADPGAAQVDQRRADVPDAAGSGTRETTLTEWVQFAIDSGEAFRQSEEKRLACVAFADKMRQTALSLMEKP